LHQKSLKNDTFFAIEDVLVMKLLLSKLVELCKIKFSDINPMVKMEVRYVIVIKLWELN